MLEDQTTFIGYDFKSIDDDKWSQQNIFHLDNEGKVSDVDENYTNSSNENHLCPLVASYFEDIDFPSDTKEFLTNLYDQVKSSFQIVKLKK